MKSLIAGVLYVSVVAFAYPAMVGYSPALGGMTISVPAGQTRAVALPLLPDVIGTGAVRGKVAVVGTSYIDVNNAGWSAGGLSGAANPYFLRLTSGNASGRIIPVSTTANTATRINLTTEGYDLTQIAGPQAGDGYELALADTLGTLFGSSTLMGGADASSADNVQIWGNTTWVTYYYNTANSKWQRSTDSAASSPRDNTLLRQDRGFMITRRAASDLTIRVTGRVPDTAPRFLHLRPGYTFFSNGVPGGITLGALALHTRAPGWKGTAGSAAAMSDADLVQIWGNTAWVSYYFDTGRGTWQRTTDSSVSNSRDSVVIPTGQPVMIRRIDAVPASADNFILVPLPYSLSQ